MKRNTRKGFTTVELVIVIAVIAILAAVLIPTFSNLVTKANNSAITQETRAAVTILLSEKDAQIPANTYIVYQKGTDTTTTKWFKYENGKLVDATEQTYDANDEVFAKQAAADIIKGASNANITIGTGEGKAAGAVLTDLSENVEILIKKS